MSNEISISSLKGPLSVYDYLKEELGITHSQIKKSGLNKKFLNRVINAKDKITIPIDLINHMLINPVSSLQSAKVIAEDDDFLILHKPPFSHMHPLRYSDTDSLLNYLATSEYGSYLKVNSSSYDRGLLYRLDYETSGLAIYAKSEDVYHEYRKNFDERIKEKYYLAICCGEMEDCTLKDNISYRGNKNARGYVSGGGEFSAFIRVEKLDYDANKDLSLVKVFLFEGIRHQIRIQLAHAGHPILGDELYGKKSADRLYLHCYEYHLEDRSFKDELFIGFSELFNLNGKL
jgi:23S rRNA pseudouridine1911/1915/1917 synthase